MTGLLCLIEEKGKKNSSRLRGRHPKEGQLGISLKVSPKGFKSARTDDASFRYVHALADASSCKAANKSTI